MGTRKRDETRKLLAEAIRLTARLTLSIQNKLHGQEGRIYVLLLP